MASVIHKLEPPEIPPLGTPIREPAGLAQAGLLAYMAVLATAYTFYFAREIFIPFFLAVVLKMLLAPLMRLLIRARLPHALAALMTVFILVSTVGGIGYAIEGPAEIWLHRVPTELPKLKTRLKDVLLPIHQVQEATRKVEEVTQSTPTQQTVVIRDESLSDYLFSGTRNLVTAAATVLLLLFALLATGDHFLRRVVESLPRFSDKKHAVEVARMVERDISMYLVTITIINLIMGCVCGAIAWRVGLPNPLLWGVLAAVLNYVPYIGPLTTMGVLSFVGIITFNKLGDAFLAPAIYAFCTLIEGNFLTPLLLSHRLQINAVAVFVGLMVFAFMWGIAGMLLALPILAMIRVICDHVEPLTPIGRFLGNGRVTVVD